MDLFALGLSCVAAIAAVGAWLVNVRAVEEARRSADAAERASAEAREANRLAGTPSISIFTSEPGVMRGGQFGLRCDIDLDSLRVELQHPPVGGPGREGRVTVSGMRGTWSLTRHRATFDEGQGNRVVTLYDVAAGEDLMVALTFAGEGRWATVRCHLVANRGEHEWRLSRRLEDVELRPQ